jgi:hypothetical protein
VPYARGRSRFPGFFPWRVSAAAAQLALGQRDATAELAREQLGLVQPYGAAGPTEIALRALGLAAGGTEGLELLAAACHELERSPALLERAKAQLEFGATLRRAGHRTDSRVLPRRELTMIIHALLNPGKHATVPLSTPNPTWGIPDEPITGR